MGCPLRAGDKVFDHLVNHLQSRYQKAPVGTGFMGFMARCFSPKGVSGLRMAIFEEVDTRQPQGEDFEAVVRSTIGTEVTPLLRSLSRTGERCSIYLWEREKRTELLIFSSEKGEVVLLKMRLDPDRLREWLNDPEGMARKKG
ncbi:hypothetical protein [Geothrix limicola]|uniref:hypothetical protein n=1 Tax=Geothrix limicola TaxID=2927978 RepID=UPI0025532E58|nr:hypothetical protein [Geothrix limicola]